MNVILSVYSIVYFREFLLPSIINADYKIVLHKDDFQLQNELVIQLENMNNQWKIKNRDDYIINKDNKPYQEEVLQDNDILQLMRSDEEKISIIVKFISNSFHPYKKYILEETHQITIGNEEKNDIIYNYLGLVSKKHAIISKSQEGYKIKNLGANGIYINFKRINDEVQLNFGDYINIVGLHMVFLDKYLAIDNFNKGLIIKEVLKSYNVDQEETILLNNKEQITKGKKLYHRSPRNFERIREETIEIEEPPQLNKTKKQSLFLMIGPSITMAFPMILGSLMMIYASNGNGIGNSLYMYSGLVMAISSAVIGVVWTLINLRNIRKEEKDFESFRLEEYGNYLVDKTNQIKEKYQLVEQKLNDNYPSAEECLNYDENSKVLWNRNRSHEDFLVHRLGKGDIPFPMHFAIPKKRFSLYKDDLADKPLFIKENYKMIYNVPITLDLTKKKLIGVVGGKNKTGAIEIAKILSTQIAANNCYTDVKLGFIYNQYSSSDINKWNFCKWFPHVWSKDKKTRFVASTSDEASDVFYELTQILRNRIDVQDSNKKIPKPYYVIFISDLSLLEGELFSKYVFDNNEALGLTTILLSERYEELPNNCEFIIENTDKFKGMYSVYDDEFQKQKILFDYVDSQRVEQFSRHLSSLQVLEIEEGGEIPNNLTFFEMLGINKLEDLQVKELWAKNRIYENIRGIIGKKAGGQPCYLDVHEKYHGPHGLVAGTTGSGKSETLQTYMLSLAINYSPDDIAFFIIDYKGGGMANLFEGLPHMVGQISNLSGNQVKRAMISIKSENRRRQRVFSENGVNNINAYTKLYKNGEATYPIPHLFIIIDEFAELKREEPEFMQELISVSQVGRSLGVHLILATQKPNGTVDDNIRSNSKFKLCLRVQDKQDSNDMLQKPDAAYITQAGRCYLQVGNDELYELFQSGFSGAIYDDSGLDGTSDIAKLINISGKIDMTGNSVKLLYKKRVEISWIEKLIECFESTINKSMLNILECLDIEYKMNDLIHCFYEELKQQNIDYNINKYNSARLEDFIHLYVKAKESDFSISLAEKILELSIQSTYKLPQLKEKTQLDAIKDYLAKIALQNHYTYKTQLWLPVLPNYIYLSDFEEFNKSCFQNKNWKNHGKEWNLNIILGKMDDPENQNQMPLVIDFKETGHIGVLGNIVCGKSTLLQTMAYALIQKYTPDYIHLYAIDFSGKMMSAFENAPHFGGVMYENEMDKIDKFFNMMDSILEERKSLFKGGNYQQYVQVNGVKLPAIIIFIDNYASFKEKTSEMYEDRIIQLSKEGISHGIYLVISGNGYGINDITTRVGENIGTVLCLSMKDKYEYANYLYTLQIDVLPENGIKGRGLTYYGNRILEYQTALAVQADNDYQRMEKIRETCLSMKQVWKGKSARKIPEIPEKPVWSQFKELDNFNKSQLSRELVPVGYNQINADVYNMPLRDIYCYLITGHKKSGKTNYMKIIIQSVCMKDSCVCIIDSPRKGLRQYQDIDEVTYVDNEKDIFDYFNNLIPEFKRRNEIKNSLLNQNYEENEVFNIIQKEKPYFIFISDLNWFIQFIYNAELDMKGFLENIIEKGSLHHIYFISELDLERCNDLIGYRIYDLFVSYKTGIHFGGKVIDNQLLSFDYIPYMEQNKQEKVGVGIISDVYDEKSARKIVVPLANK